MSKSLSERDQAVIWHPYTPMKLADPPIGIVKGAGAMLYAEDGKSYIDATSSWWVNIHGHAHPYIQKKVAAQLLELEHVIFAGFTHEPAVELAERVLSHLPGDQARVFYSDNGSTAIEVALKMAFQYWANKGEEKLEVVVLDGSYHGDTFGAMSVSERNAFTAPFQKLLFDVHALQKPDHSNAEEVLDQLEELLKHGRVAAMIVEPLMMGVAGMHTYPADLLEAMVQLCKKYDVLFIADEVLTGFGRTGTWFACDQAEGIEPDIICLSKGLTGGTMALGVTTCTRGVFDAFLSDDRSKTLFHGHSFTANPVACAASLASMDLMEQQGTWDNIERINLQHQDFLDRLEQMPMVTNARVLGTMLAFEVNTGGENSYFHDLRDHMYHFFLNRGILLRPLGNTLYILPPYCITSEQLNTVYEGITDMLEGIR